jgi:manganese/zinc/iron transport system substrate-binding protein
MGFNMRFEVMRTVAMALTVGLLSCERSDTPSAEVNGKPLVVATTTMIADLVRAVGGEAVEVEGLMGPGVDPHLYKPSGDDARLLRDARAIFYNGLQLEGRMTEIFERMNRQGEKAYALSRAVPDEALISPDGEGEHADPHLWGDVKLWAGCVEVVVAGLSAAVPEETAGFAARGRVVQERLLELDAWVKEQVGRLPPERRILITSHDAFSYFGRAYGFEVLGVQGISTVSEAGLADVARMVDLIKQRGVKAIFVESSVSHGTIEQISRDSGARVGGELFSDALGGREERRVVAGEDLAVGTYEGMVRFNVSTIVEGLK